jgi:hypothetical protein
VRFPVVPQIWSVSDLGEPGRISSVEPQRQVYRESVFQEIIANVDRLISSPVSRLAGAAAAGSGSPAGRER